eukprot:15469419-Alexandrium_andersonii.AAC.1
MLSAWSSPPRRRCHERPPSSGPAPPALRGRPPLPPRPRTPHRPPGSAPRSPRPHRRQARHAPPGWA